MATVEVSQGILKGAISKTDSGYEYYEFLSVPYAKPPIGALRFQSPQPPEPWIDERDATKCDKINIACQADFRTAVTLGSEDCLYLNVYTPQLPTPGSAPLPVIVFIHGGGFVSGNGIIKEETGPDYLVEQNTVVVTINYRLGVFGFLSLDIPEAAGNMGLKDQVKALEWVRDNIESFGGDTNNVTIMGLSAGSASVDYLVLSPTAKGLFHKAIMMSGSALNHWAINLQPTDLALELVKLLDYKGSLDDKKAVHKFLLTRPEKELTLAAAQAISKCNSKRLYFGFVPTIENDYGNDDAFITSSPFKILKEEKFNTVPVLRGFTNREGFLSFAMNPNTKKFLTDTKSFIGAYAFRIEPNIKEEYNARFTSAYLDQDIEIEKTIEDFLTDLDFASGVWIAGKMSSKAVPVYMYQFGYAGKTNFFKTVFGLSSDEPGAMHGDDYTYLFKMEANKNADENDVLVRKRAVSMFTNFAKFGKPVTDISDLITVDWPEFSEESTNYLVIDKELYVEDNYRPNQMAIFEELYEKSFE